jgi:hypothetical protein
MTTDQPRDQDDLNRELIELLNELRVALPGVQVLFAFLLIVPFSNGWQRVTDTQRDVYFAAFLCAAASSAFLIAPSAIHRLRFRGGDKENLLLVGNRLAIVGTAFLAAGMAAVTYLITDTLFDGVWGAVVTALIAGLMAWLWFGYPLLRMARKR